MNVEQAILFDITEEQIQGLYTEIALLSKKKPDEAVNKFKLQFINELLEKINSLLTKNYLPFRDFRSFDVEMLPTTSDVALVLSQYLKVMEKFRFDHTKRFSGEWFWILNEDEEGPKTRRPHIQ
jgi:hypothetical protein